MKIVKSLINGVAFCLLFSLFLTLTKGVPFMQTLVRPDVLLGAGCTALGSFIGYSLRENRRKPETF